MKKILLAAAAVAISASTVFASATITTSTSIGNSAISFAPSNKVYVYVISDSGDPANNNPGGFAAESQHLSGSRTFAVNSISTKIYWVDGLSGAVPSAASEAFSSWKTM